MQMGAREGMDQFSTLASPTNPRVLELYSLAQELGYAVEVESTWEKMLARQMVAKLTKRSGKFVMQSAAFSMKAFPLQVAKRLFPPCHLTTSAGEEALEPARLHTWRFESEREVYQIFAELLTKYARKREVVGITRALQSKSERVVRLVASLMGGVEVSHTHADGVPTLWVNFLYTLCSDTGELFKPKTPDRREIELEPSIRQHILADATAMGEKGFAMSPAWWRQMGREDQALEVEQWLAAPRRLTSSSRRTTPARPPAAPTYEVDCIVQESKSSGKARKWFRVRWLGYEPAWEAWRESGEAGSPLETWEPLSHVKHTDALRRWVSMRARRQQL